MPEKDRPSAKDEERYEALLKEGAGKEKAARIANTPPSEAGKRGGKAEPKDGQIEKADGWDQLIRISNTIQSQAVW